VLDTETWILECNERAQKQGGQLTGKAAFSFVLARQGGKIVIESTGTEYSQFPAPFSECMRDVSQKMTFEELPEGVDALIAYRKVVFEDGFAEGELDDRVPHAAPRAGEQLIAYGCSSHPAPFVLERLGFAGGASGMTFANT